jgi:DNA-binding LacI/PurR family transcriptional regulator
MVTEACLLAGLKVPEEVAVLAGDHDELMVSIATPRLSTNFTLWGSSNGRATAGS